MTSDLTESRLRIALGGRPFRWYARIGSTNDAAREWAAAGAPHGAVVVADEQTAGRGRFTRHWNAPAGTALLLSVIMRLLPAQRNYLTRLPLVGAVAVADVLTALPIVVGTAGRPSIGIKWPNDVLLDARKVAGVLAETDWQESTPTVGVLGIGLNVRVDFAGSELETRATSLEPALGRSIDRAALLASLLARIDHWLARLSEPALIGAWRTQLVTIGQQVTARAVEADHAPPISGVAIGADDFGALLVQTADGTLHRVVAGEVTLQTP